MHRKGFRGQFLYPNKHLLLPERKLVQLNVLLFKFSLPEAGTIYNSFSLVLWLVKIHHLMFFSMHYWRQDTRPFWLSALASSPWNSQLLKHGGNPFCSQLNEATHILNTECHMWGVSRAFKLQHVAMFDFVFHIPKQHGEKSILKLLQQTL